MDLPSKGWHVFSTHDVPWRVVKICLERNAEIVDKTFCWVNNPVCPEVVGALSAHPSVGGCLVTNGPVRNLAIYDTPYQTGDLCRRWLSAPRAPGLPPPWVVFHDDDDMWPVAAGFPQYLADWIESGSQVMVMRQLYLWGHPNVCRIDNFRTIGWHARYAKVPAGGLKWSPPIQTRCRPHADESETWCCPWPLLHFTVFDRGMRQRYHDRRRLKTPGGMKGDGTDIRYHVDVPDAHLLKYDPEIMCVELVSMLRSADAGVYPSGSWQDGDGSWTEDFKGEVPYYDNDASVARRKAGED